jgi:hypothetical protein
MKKKQELEQPWRIGLGFPSTGTTGNAAFAEGFRLCRELNIGHSAKTLFVEGWPKEP